MITIRRKQKKQHQFMMCSRLLPNHWVSLKGPEMEHEWQEPIREVLKVKPGISLVRNAEGPGLILGQGTRYHMVCILSRFNYVQLFATLWTTACQGPLSMGFSGQEYWSRLPCPPPENLPNPGIKPVSHWTLPWQSVSLPLGPPCCNYEFT